MKLWLKVRNTFFEEITEEQFIKIERERKKLKKKLSLVLKILLFVLMALLTAFILSLIMDK